jgi:glycosyltransferase involved in cell wall biosynthesis
MSLRKEIISGITRLMHLARSGEIIEAERLGSTLATSLHGCEPAFAVKQYELLQRLQARYGLKFPAAMPSPDIQPVSLALDDFVTDIKPGISLVTCTMNRSENLLKALRSWVQCPEISQIIIVDWSSTNPFRDDLAASGIDDARILVARVQGQSRWILSYAFNFGFRLAAYDKILKTDADIIIHSRFFAENDLKSSTFLSGDWRTAAKGQEHINGFFFIRRDDLFGVKGFNEYITTYGWDDDDLYFRIEQMGCNRVRVKTGGIYHIPHGDTQRIGKNNFPENALEEMLRDPAVKIIGNRFLAAAMPLWGANHTFIPFQVVGIANGYLEAKQSKEGWYQAPPHAKRDAEYYGLVNVVSWNTEQSAFYIPKESLVELLSIRSDRSEITRMDMRLAACGAAPVKWRSRVIVLYFQEGVALESRLHAATWLAAQGSQQDFSLFVEAPLYQHIGACPQGGDLQTVWPIPDGFYTQDLYQMPADRLQELPECFSKVPAFWVSIALREINALQGEGFPEIAARRDRIYIHVQHGLGNRLRAMVSAMAIAQATDRELMVIWTPDHHCDCYLSDLFNYPGTVLADATEADLENSDRYTYMEIEPGARKDQYIALVPGRDIYIRSAYVINNEHSDWETENRLLRSLEPADAVKQLVASVASDGRLGIHVRMEGMPGTDTNSYDAPDNWLAESHQQLNLWRGRSHYGRFMARIDQLIVTQPELELFVAADMQTTYQIFAEKYGDRLSYLPRTRFDRSSEQMRYALADAILLSRCNALLGSTWSSFSELAQRLSVTLNRIEMSGTDF